MNVVIVESPAKAKTINGYLGSDYEVLASFGHVRDLPAKDGSVDPEQDFAMQWEVDDKAAKRLSDIVRAVKGSDKVILATDPDREGEAISWHVLEVLRARKVLKDKKVERVVFNAITKSAVRDAMQHPRDLDQPLVDAYLARRALDYLVGFNLSPVLWRKLPGSRSAGRVQSVALRLVCAREREIEEFRAREYWSLVAHLRTAAGIAFEARLVGADGRKITRLDIGTGEEAHAFRAALDAARFAVASVEAKPVKRHPFPPFRTSTLQQDASRKLGLSPARTMQIAQKLYEGVTIRGETTGLITYMRTDGVDMAPEAIAGTRRVIGDNYGERYLPQVPRKYTVKAKNAQEAHEAIRPTDLSRLPRDMAPYLDAEQLRVYELIWKRTVASQMESAELERTTVDIAAEVAGRKLDLRATGQVVRFDGFLTLYGVDDDDVDQDGKLPAMAAGETLGKDRVDADQHFTEPPPRYSEEGLIKRMEELGIGRPSTYAATLAVLRDREYVRLEKKKLIPEDKGRLVTAFLESFFERWVDYDFTAGLEESLDRVSNDELDWRQVLRDFWRDFSAAIGDTKELRTTEVLDNLNEVLAPLVFPPKADGSDPRACPVCGEGRLSLKLGKFGSFVGCSNYPECKFTRTLSTDPNAPPLGDAEKPGQRLLGTDLESGLEVTLRDGRFGTYLQLGEGEKPKRSSLPKGLKPADVDLETALVLLSLPRPVARHPTTGEPILAGIGRYGPYVQHGKTYANLDDADDVLTIGANRAIDLVVAKEEGRGGRRGGGAPSGTVLGEHPDGGSVTLRDGRFGPYVNAGKVNATLPKGTDPSTLTLDDALRLIAAKAEQTGLSPSKKKAPAKKAAASKTATAAKAASAKTTGAKTTGAKTAVAKTTTAKATATKATAAKAPSTAKAATAKAAATKAPAAKAAAPRAKKTA
jgi:DNA topoisomerase-1